MMLVALTQCDNVVASHDYDDDGADDVADVDSDDGIHLCYHSDVA